jgi:polyhydroxyalkanoate synthesis regulator phasin
MASEPKTAERETEEESTRSEASLQAFREALEKSVTISRDKLQEIVDDAVRRGRMTRSDAEELVGRVLNRGREQVEDLLKQIEPLVSDARRDVTERVTKTAKRARDSADQPLAQADRLRRRAGLPGFPITAYDQLSVPQISNRLAELESDDLEKVRDYERGHRNRVGVLRAIERRLQSSG